jgi:hypothetical protein
MREPSSGKKPFALIAEFDAPARLAEAARKTRENGYVSIDTCSPYPFDELQEALGTSENLVPWLCFAGGVLGAVTGYGLQVYTNYAYPIPVGGRPLFAWQPFMFITFELSILFAVSFAIFGMLLLNRLPRLHHPVFDVPDFHLGDFSKFFLVIFSNDPKFDATETETFLRSLDPVRVEIIQPTEEPE